MSEVKHKYVTTENAYINAHVEGDKIYIIEKDKNNNRVIKEDYLDYVFYTLDDYGQHKTIFGERCTRHEYNSKGAFFAAMKQYPKESIYEHDVNHTFRYLSKNYDFDAMPELNVAIYDIEVEFRPETRYSNADDAANSIISIAVYHKWSKQIYCVVLPPPNKTIAETQTIASKLASKYEGNAEIVVVKTEAELLKVFFLLIEDADVITGWNSEAYDFKYIVNRIVRVLGEHAVKNLSPLKRNPKERTAFNEKTKSYYSVYEPVGLVHLDYQLLYKKYTYSELSSYSLDNVSYVELDDQKVDYEGSLYELYLNDTETFIEYNIKDVTLIDRLDEKLKFIDLTNLLAHNNGVLMQTTLGTVALTEQAIINEGHYYFDEPVVFPSRPEKNESAAGAAGAFVVNPKTGVRREVSGIDIESLYPSVIRCLNMSPETLVGHINSDRTDQTILDLVANGEVKKTSEAWHRFFNTLEFDEIINKTDNKVKLEFNRSDRVIEATGKEIYDLIFNDPNLCISANGTIFSKEKTGVIPSLLTRWFFERRVLKGKKDEWKDKLDEATTDAEKTECKYWITFYDQRQLAKKINLNALYGALLNKSCRFYDKRIGQSTTLTGRSITRHMGSQTNLIICGEYSHTGDCVVYGDSVTGDTILATNFGNKTISELFDECDIKWEGEEGTNKEYANMKGLMVLTYDPILEEPYYGEINYIYRHKTRKGKWRITDSEGNMVVVTSDHSIMIERNGVLVHIKPEDMVVGDVVIGVMNEDF